MRSARYEKNKAAMRQRRRRKKPSDADRARWRKASQAARRRAWEAVPVEQKLEFTEDRTRCWHRLLCVDRCRRRARWVNVDTATTWCDRHKPTQGRLEPVR